MKMGNYRIEYLVLRIEKTSMLKKQNVTSSDFRRKLYREVLWSKTVKRHEILGVKTERSQLSLLIYHYYKKQ